MFTFHISNTDASAEKAGHKVTLCGNQTLADLHQAIQSACGWNSDRLYSFFMSDQAWDQDSEYTLPQEGEWSQAFEKPLLPKLNERQRAAIVRQVTRKFGETPDITADVLADLQKPAGGPCDARAARLEALGLEVGQTFLYLFDYADERGIHIQVEAIAG